MHTTQHARRYTHKMHARTAFSLGLKLELFIRLAPDKVYIVFLCGRIFVFFCYGRDCLVSLISPRRLCCRREQDKAQAVTENEELRKKNKQLMQECEEVSENRLQLVGMLTPPFRFRPSNHRGRSGDGGGGILVAEELRPLERRGGSRYCFATFLAS